MAFYNPEKQIVIGRNEGVGKWAIVLPNGAHNPTAFDVTEKAGKVARAVAQLHPKKQVGILSDSIGPAARRAYGEVVWLVKDFFSVNF